MTNIDRHKDIPSTAVETYAAARHLAVPYLLKRGLGEEGEIATSLVDTVATHLHKYGRAEAARALPTLAESLLASRLARIRAHVDALEEDEAHEAASASRGRYPDELHSKGEA